MDIFLYFCSMNILFDLDGTLLNTIDDLGYACNYALSKQGYPTHPISAYPAMVGNGINMLIRRALPAAEQTDERVAAVRKDFVLYYNVHNCDYTRPYEGIPELLTALKAAGHHLGVASNKYHEATCAIIGHFFPDTFDVVMGEQEGIPRKPDPKIVFDIVERLTGGDGPREKLSNSDSGLTAQRSVLFIGDSLVDRDTAKNAGLDFVACAWGFVPRAQLLSAGIKHIVDSPDEILQFVS